MNTSEMSVAVKKLFGKVVEVICFVLGPTLIITNVLDFEVTYRGLISYHKDTRANIGIGVALVAFGVLRRYWSKKEADK